MLWLLQEPQQPHIMACEMLWTIWKFSNLWKLCLNWSLRTIFEDLRQYEASRKSQFQNTAKTDVSSRVENTFCIPGDSWKRFPQVHLYCRIDREFSLKECTLNKPLINHHFKTPFYLLLNWNIVYGPNNKGICIYIIQFNPITCVL